MSDQKQDHNELITELDKDFDDSCMSICQMANFLYGHLKTAGREVMELRRKLESVRALFGTDPL